MLEENDNWRRLQPQKPLNLHGRDRSFAAVDLRVAAKDRMYNGNDAYYLEVGANALHLIDRSLAAISRRSDEIRLLLDYACGFGRVLRWLCAAFPQAQIVAADADAKAIAAVKELFEVDTFTLDRSLRENIGNDFDLIWVGSLATHLPEEALQALLFRLHSLLSNHGLLVATIHGHYVAGRISRGEKNYGLDASETEALLESYRRDGYGFGAYPGQSSYGIAVSTASKVLSMCEVAHLRPILFQERAWVRHQDCFAVVKMTD